MSSGSNLNPLRGVERVRRRAASVGSDSQDRPVGFLEVHQAAGDKEIEVATNNDCEEEA
jgi:hypothetical protein